MTWLTENLDKRCKLVKSERKKARVTAKLDGEIKQKSFSQRPFTLCEYLFVHEKADVKTIRRNHKKLGAMIHPDVGQCKNHFRTIYLSYAFLKDEKTGENFDQRGLEKNRGRALEKKQLE